VKCERIEVSQKVDMNQVRSAAGPRCSLRLPCHPGGEERQSSTTGHMVHGVPRLIEFLSEHITLQPGDVIATGTPSGVGYFRRRAR
jgi:2-keto-4-pentenoate hydratase/2-oxohepta-3-ene-1,7-dioic acid hydratase in catechol pathway